MPGVHTSDRFQDMALAHIMLGDLNIDYEEEV
jgi:hypothetical protein